MQPRRRQIQRSLYILLTLAAAGGSSICALAAPSSAMAMKGSRVVTCTSIAPGTPCPWFAAHPGLIVFGADGRTVLSGIHWTHWGSRSPSATATLREDSGAAGHPRYQYARANVRARRLAGCRGQRAYTELDVRARPFGPRPAVYRVSCTPRPRPAPATAATPVRCGRALTGEIPYDVWFDNGSAVGVTCQLAGDVLSAFYTSYPVGPTSNIGITADGQTWFCGTADSELAPLLAVCFFPNSLNATAQISAYTPGANRP